MQLNPSIIPLEVSLPKPIISDHIHVHEIIANIDFQSIAISIVNSFHPSAQQKQADFMNVELDIEKRL